MNVAAQQVDIYSHERAGLMERLCVLAGVTTYREPVGSFTAPTGRVPNAHVLAAALAFARDHSGLSRDVGPDILEALVLQRITIHADNITGKLGCALRDVSTRMRSIDYTVMRHACHRVLAGCVYGKEAVRTKGVTAHDWRFIETYGTRTLWASAEQTLNEVKRKLHQL